MLRLFRKRRRAVREPSDLLALPLLQWSHDDAWTLRDAVEGTLILGATGSGKTSGSGRLIARTMLSCGFGGLVLTAKADERALWEGYCRDTNRLDDLVVFGPGEPHRFNFLDHEMTRKGSGAGLTENVVNLLSTVLEVAERQSAGGGGRDDEGYWKRALRQLCRNVVDLLALGRGRIAVPDLYRVVVSAPTSTEQVCSDGWKQGSECFRWLSEADKRDKTPRERADFEIAADYWLREFPSLSDKTRSVIVSTFTSLVDVLNRGLLRELFCGETTITPEAVQDGKIILIDLPVKEFGEVGQFAQVLWKYAFQRSIERRSVQLNPRPAFLWADEAQHFLTSYDFQFQATCRSSWVATVLLSQNYSNFVAALGGNEKGRVETDSLLALLTTKVFHSTGGDPVSGELASRIIGRSLQLLGSGNHSHAADDQLSALLGLDWTRENGSTSAGFTEAWEHELQPRDLTRERLRTGGPENGWIVDGIVYQGGRVFRASGRSWLPVQFNQRA